MNNKVYEAERPYTANKLANALLAEISTLRGTCCAMMRTRIGSVGFGGKYSYRLIAGVMEDGAFYTRAPGSLHLGHTVAEAVEALENLRKEESVAAPVSVVPAREDKPAPLLDNYTIATAQGAILAEIRTVDLHTPAPVDDVSVGSIREYTTESANARLEAARANYNGYNSYEVMAAKDAARRAKAEAEKRERAQAYLAEKFPHLFPAPAPVEENAPAPQPETDTATEAHATEAQPEAAHVAALEARVSALEAKLDAKPAPAPQPSVIPTGSILYHTTAAGAEAYTVTGTREMKNGLNYWCQADGGRGRSLVSAKEFARKRREWFTAAEYAADLRAEVEYHEEAYYVKVAPEISDKEFDAKFRALRAVEASAPEAVSPQSPTQRPGGRAAISPVNGRAPMLSMHAAESLDELAELAALGAVCVMPKVDGCSVQLEYENGKLARGYLRGDGRTGEDVTENLRAAPGVPAKIPFSGPLTVRGEAYIEMADLARLQKEHPGKFQVAAPAVSGTLRQHSPDVCRARGLRFMAFERVGAPGFHAAHLRELERLGFAVVPSCVYFNFEEAKAEMERVWARRAQLPYAIDGMVMRLNSAAQFAAQGETGREAKGLLAWKFDAQRAQAEIVRLETLTGKAGRRTVTAHITPALLGGKVIRKVNIGWATYARRLGLAAGDKIEIALKGGTVPVLSRVINNENQDMAA